MNMIFLNDCAVDGCYKRNVKGAQMCKKHQTMYEAGIPLKAFYGKTVQKKLNKDAHPQTAKLE